MKLRWSASAKTTTHPELALLTERRAAATDRVRFGATVTVREVNEEETRTASWVWMKRTIKRGAVNWLSPIARALMNVRAGQRVTFQSPDGERKL